VRVDLLFDFAPHTECIAAVKMAKLCTPVNGFWAHLSSAAVSLPVVLELHRHAVAPKKTGDRARRGGPDGQRFDDIILIHLPGALIRGI